MNLLTITACLLIIAGAGVMAVSILRFRGIFRLLHEFEIEEHAKIKRLFNTHQTLMILFFIGYLAVLYGIIAKIAIFGDLIVGIIFFFGAVFVFLSVLLQSKMLSSAKSRYSQAVEVSSSLQGERSKLMLANEQLIREMEERRMAEEALQESQNRLKTVFDSVQAGIIIIDPENHMIIDANSIAVKMIGASKGEVIGHECRQYICPAQKNSCPITDLGQKLDNSERSLLTKNGKSIPILKTVIPILLNGRPHLLESFIDIKNIKQAEEERVKLENQLRRARHMEAIGTLAGGVAHDLNNILLGIVSYPDLLLMQLPENSPLRKPIKTIKDSGQKAAAIVQDLLTLARREVATTEVTNLNTIISEYLISPEYEKLKSFHPVVQVETNLEQDLLSILGSPVHLSKTVMNLVSNAAEAMAEGGKLSICTENRYVDRTIKGYDKIKEGDYVVLTVSDTGVGIASEEIEKIFEPFYTKKVLGKSGTGLGMAVVWGSVKDHKGYIDVQSTLEKGSTFTLFFPAARYDKETAKGQSDFIMEDYLGKGESILVIDDVRQQREIASKILSDLGYSVKTVSSGEEAVDYLKNNSVDLLLLDMIMDPGIDGLETYKQIIKIHPGQKAIIVSGFSETNRVKKAQRLGVGQYIRKPYILKKIVMAVRTELDK